MLNSTKTIIQDFQSQNIAQNMAIDGFEVSLVAEHSILSCLDEDASCLASSAVQTFFEACADLKSGNVSWAAVKFYYSIFYTAQSIAAKNGTLHFYYSGRPKCYKVNSTEGISKLKGNSHDIVWKYYKENFANSKFLTEINGYPAVEYFKRIREHANYRQGQFGDPNFDFEGLAANSGQIENLSVYASDKENYFTFDLDHAFVAFPMRFLIENNHFDFKYIPYYRKRKIVELAKQINFNVKLLF